MSNHGEHDRSVGARPTFCAFFFLTIIILLTRGGEGKDERNDAGIPDPYRYV